MSGHSKWATTKAHKFAQDAKRSQMFQKFSKEIMVAATIGGPDPDSNPALKLAIARAKSRSMPKANIDKAIAKVAGGAKDGNNFQSYFYSGTAFGGVTFLVSCLTDNFNRLSSNIKHHFLHANGSLGKQGSIPYVFEQKGTLDSGASDFEVEEENYVITTEPSQFSNVKQALDDAFKIENYSTSEVTYVPNSYVEISEDKVAQLEKFIDLLEDDEDVQDVYHNAEL